MKNFIKPVLKHKFKCILYHAVFVLLFFLTVTNLKADINNIILYPSPVNINVESITIGPQPGYTFYDTYHLSVKIEIFTVSGDSVFSKIIKTTGFNDFHWRGYTNGGKKVSQGLYIAKITIENEDNGIVETKKIRFLVKK